MAAHCPLMAFLCLAGALLTAGAAVENDQGCPEGWTPFGTRCFKFFDSYVTWTEAEKSCQSHGANLASIHSAEENAIVANLLKEGNGGHDYAWIGGLDAIKERLWMWSDGSVWDYSSWAPNQPSNSNGNQHFVMIFWIADPPTFWSDIPEYIQLEYICAKDAPRKAEPEGKSVSLTLGGSLYKCTPDIK